MCWTGATGGRRGWGWPWKDISFVLRILQAGGQAGRRGRLHPQDPTTAMSGKRLLLPWYCPFPQHRLLAQGGAGHSGCRAVLLPLHTERQDPRHVNLRCLACLQSCTGVACCCGTLLHSQCHPTHPSPLPTWRVCSLCSAGCCRTCKRRGWASSMPACSAWACSPTRWGTSAPLAACLSASLQASGAFCVPAPAPLPASCLHSTGPGL
jgi:hypothetical protein